MTTARTPRLSIVLPIHDERDSLAPLLDEISGVLTHADTSFEVIAVDDGSTDGSTSILRGLACNRPWLRVILLRRNCGQSAALDAGFRAAEGEFVATMDADGQNDPSDIPRLMDVLVSEECDFVSGRRAKRQDALIVRKLPSFIANAIIRCVTRTRMRDLGCSLKLYRRDLVDDLHLYGEMHRFIAVLVEGMGARSVEVDVNHRPRRAGKSKYGVGRAYKVVLDLITVWFMRGYETKPIYIFGGVGMGLGALGVMLAAFVLYQKLALDIYVHRNPLFILAVIMAVIGMQFVVLGLLAEILVRTYFESRQRPSYHIRERINFESGLPVPDIREPKPPLWLVGGTGAPVSPSHAGAGIVEG